jgi:hypothetical protein
MVDDDSAKALTWDTRHIGPHQSHRFGEPFEHGSVFGYLADSVEGVLTYELAPPKVVIQNVSIDRRELRRTGGGSALIGEVERVYPGPAWHLAIDDTEANSWAGQNLIASRRRRGRWIHTSDCEDLDEPTCTCEFVNLPLGPDVAYDNEDLA